MSTYQESLMDRKREEIRAIRSELERVKNGAKELAHQWRGRAEIMGRLNMNPGAKEYSVAARNGKMQSYRDAAEELEKLFNLPTEPEKES
jgi:hypothetical protein